MEEEEIIKNLKNLAGHLEAINEGMSYLSEKIGKVSDSIPKKTKVSIGSMGEVELESESLDMDSLIKKGLDIRNKLNGFVVKNPKSYLN